MNEHEFKKFAKIPRWSRELVITEKIDGTNGCIYISEDGEFLVGSRNRWITPDDDNYGFAAWAHENKEELMKLGPGRHYGEWWGHGIQRGYGLPKGDRRFSLFNVERWLPCMPQSEPEEISLIPRCAHVVPVIQRVDMDSVRVGNVLAVLRNHGSYAAPGFMKPEGIVLYHTASGNLYKKTFGADGHKTR